MSSLHIPKFGTYKVQGSLSLLPGKLSSKSIPSATMDLNSPPVEMFFPFVGGGHQIPMIDIARVFASHGAKATIITTPKHFPLLPNIHPP